MLEEMDGVRQHPGEPRRRWFTSADADLYVWAEGEEIVSFRFCYDKQSDEHALSWDAREGVKHDRIDDGECSTKYKMTPILVPDGDFDLGELIRKFTGQSEKVDPQIVEFVVEKLREVPEGGGLPDPPGR
jgi:hypothetical protein